MRALNNSVNSAPAKSHVGVGLFIALAAALFLPALDQTVLNTAIPKISAELNGFDRAPWIITSYLLCSTLITPITGKLADLYGAKKVILAATAFFIVASALCGAAGSAGNFGAFDQMSQLIAARALQGIAGGALLSICFISLGDLVPASERGRHQGWLAAAFIVAALLGPVLGGWLVDNNQWRNVFYMNIPFGIVSILLLQLFFPISSRPLSTLNQALVPLDLFKNRLIKISLVTVFVNGIALFGGSLLLAVLFQRVLGMSASESGLALTPLMLLVALASILGGWWMSKTGHYKALCITSLLLVAIGSYLLSLIGPNSSLSTTLTFAAISGIGLGLILPVHAIIIQNTVHGSVMGLATSLTQFSRSLGGTIGTAFMTALLLALLKQGSLQTSISSIFQIYALTAFFTLVLNLFLSEVPLNKVTTRVLASLTILLCTVTGAQAASTYHNQSEIGKELNIPVHKWIDAEQNIKGVVFAIPGLVFTGHAYDSMARHLTSKGYVVYSGDLRGYGEWTKEEAKFDGDNLIHYTQSKEDVTRVLRALRNHYPDKPIFCMGESFGANYAVWEASTNPQLMDGVIASGLSYKIVINPRPRWLLTFAQGVRHPKKPLNLKPYLEPILSEDKAMTRARLNEPDTSTALSIADLIKAAMTTKKAIKQVDKIPPNLPILLIAGEKDRIQKTNTLPQLVKMMGSKQVKLVVIPKRGHLLFEENKLDPKVAELVDGWLKNQTAAHAAMASSANAALK